jgi:type IV secretory pathway component VirB8
MIDKSSTEIIERLVRIETKLDFYKDEITDLKDKNKWLWRTFFGAIIISVISTIKGVVLK